MAHAIDERALPAAGCFRPRALTPREFLARAGSHMLAPPQHPAAEKSLQSVQTPRESMPLETIMHVHRQPRAEHIEASLLPWEINPAGERPRAAGVFSRQQIAKTRSEFKSHATHGQYSTELVSSVPQSRKLYNSIRGETSAYQPHHSATYAIRRHLDAVEPMKC
mmetsp:Transcript_56411/g.89590  ORF Transcript_56411/g.89590 Transcript_56411/m.89590 type:complete len:165 (-) Transcript_56411:119-613(-)